MASAIALNLIIAALVGVFVPLSSIDPDAIRRRARA